MAVEVRKSKDLTLTDKLSRLTFTQACELLGGVVEAKNFFTRAERFWLKT
jgi:hypothetical protein